MPLYKTLADFGELLPAEEKVLARMAGDERVVIDETARIGGPAPAIGDAAHKIRAEFIAFLARGGAKGAEPPPRGLRILGAWIAGTLDLRGPAIDRDLGLYACRFDAPPNLQSARLANLYLNGSHLPGIRADRLEAKGGVFLRQATVEGEARFLGAQLGGDLSCVGARFSRKDGHALIADGLEAKGHVFLHQATVEGEARFLGARLGGDLSCVGAWFSRKDGHALNADGLEAKGGVFLRQATVEGETRFLGARLGGNLSCVGAQFENAGKVALGLDGARVAGALLLRDGARLRGILAMTGASFGDIIDACDGWPGPGDLILNRCRYEAFTGGPVDARSRLEWLALQDPPRFGQDFWPQPYEQLARVFREMGHTADARAVLMEKERLQRAARRAQVGWGLWLLLAARDAGLAVTVRYGRQPLWAFAWLGGLVLLGWGVFYVAERADAIKPNQVFVARSAEWVACGYEKDTEIERFVGPNAPTGARTSDHASRLACFEDTAQGADYPRFNAFAYSVDTLFPLVDLEMQSYWIPDETATHFAFARHTRWYLWLHIALGWGLSLLAVAGFSGLVKSD